MKTPAIVRVVAALCLLLASNAASTTVLTITMPDGYTLQSTCASDPGCQLQAGLPAAFSPGHIADQAFMPVSSHDFSNAPSSFAAGGTEDDVFLSLTGSQPTTSPNVPAERNDAAGEVTDDQALLRKFSLGLRRTYTSIHALVALPDHYQGNAREVGNTVSGQCHEGGAAGANAECAAGGFAPVMSSLCVASDGSYNSIGAASQAACPAGSIYVGHKRGAGTAEYAAYVQSLRNFAKDAASRYSLQSVDERYFHNEAIPRQYRRCSECDVDQTHAQEPGLLLQAMKWLREPSSMLLLGLGLVAVLVGDAVVRGRRA